LLWLLAACCLLVALLVACWLLAGCFAGCLLVACWLLAYYIISLNINFYNYMGKKEQINLI
jgi:hypothetical protein